MHRAQPSPHSHAGDVSGHTSVGGKPPVPPVPPVPDVPPVDEPPVPPLGDPPLPDVPQTDGVPPVPDVPPVEPPVPPCPFGIPSQFQSFASGGPSGDVG